MARGKKSGGKDFKPGNPGGPGRPVVPEELKTARAINKVELERVLNKYINISFNELVSAMKDPSTTTLDLTVCKIISEAIKRGDQSRLAFIFKYLDLEPTQKLDVSGSLHTVLVDLISKHEDEK